MNALKIQAQKGPSRRTLPSASMQHIYLPCGTHSYKYIKRLKTWFVLSLDCKTTNTIISMSWNTSLWKTRVLSGFLILIFTKCTKKSEYIGTSIVTVSAQSWWHRTWWHRTTCCSFCRGLLINIYCNITFQVYLSVISQPSSLARKQSKLKWGILSHCCSGKAT